MKKMLLFLWPLVLSSFLLTGCGTTVTNLTPGTQKRTPSGLYPFEVALDTNAERIKEQTLKPYVLIGPDIYAMQPTLNIKNRWETVVPIPANSEFVSYRFKFDYDYRSIPKAQPTSILSRPFQLQIQDK